jgi:hypothetical protein
MAGTGGNRLVSCTGTRDNDAMILTVPDAGLDALIASPSALSNTWSTAWQDVKAFLQFLRKAASLGHVVAMGMVELLTPSKDASPGQVVLADGPIVLNGIAGDQSGVTILAPYVETASVQHLRVTDLTVGGRSGLRLAG